MDRVTAVQYFGLVLAKYAVATGQDSSAMTAFGGLKPPLSEATYPHSMSLDRRPPELAASGDTNWLEGFEPLAAYQRRP